MKITEVGNESSLVVQKWARVLFDNMEFEFRKGQRRDLPVDPKAIGIAHVLHGLDMLAHLTDCPPSIVANWLGFVSLCISKGEDLPILAWEVYPFGERNGTKH